MSDKKQYNHVVWEHTVEYGISLRDWFAGQAMVAYARESRPLYCRFESVAIDAYALADTMLEVRELTRNSSKNSNSSKEEGK